MLVCCQAQKKNVGRIERVLTRGTMWKTNGKEGERSMGMETAIGEGWWCGGDVGVGKMRPTIV